MPLRKASSYSKKKVTPYTRKSAKKKKSYVKTVPHNKIVRFKMGRKSDYEQGKLKNIIKLVSGEKILIRDNALEAARKFILRNLQKELPEQFYLEVKTYPHHILRENKVYSGASKGDRYNTGMSQSFGSVMGSAAIVKKNQAIFIIALEDEKKRGVVNKILNKVKPKLPCHSRILFEKKE
jgi:large subunit ribosomal protein L10e